MLPAVLREEPRYRLLFAGQTLSVVGDRIAFIALAFAVLSIGDLGDLGIVTAAASLPFLIVALPGGAISDRVGRREVMLVADCARALIQAISALASWTRCSATVCGIRPLIAGPKNASAVP